MNKKNQIIFILNCMMVFLAIIAICVCCYAGHYFITADLVVEKKAHFENTIRTELERERIEKEIRKEFDLKYNKKD